MPFSRPLRYVGPFLLALILSALALRPAMGQHDPTVMGPFAGDPIFKEGNYLAIRGEPGDEERAAAEFRRIAEENPGTELEATARLKIAWVNGDLNELRVVMERFPQTCYWFIASDMLISRTSATRAEQISKRGDLLHEVGAPSVAEILDDVPDPPFSELSIAPQFRPYVYLRIYRMELLERDLPRDQYIRGAEFLRRSFPQTAGVEPIMSVADFITPSLEQEPDVPWPEAPEKTPPVILRMTPADGGVLEGSWIMVEATDGDFWQNQIEPQDTRVTVDGQDFTDKVAYDSRITLLRSAPHFEVLTLRIPTDTLAPGSHTIRLTLSDRIDNIQTTTWSFTKPPAPPLKLSVEVQSKHVKPRKNQVALLTARSDHGPVSYVFAVYRVRAGQVHHSGDGPVYSQASLSPDGTIAFQWNGLDNAGIPVANGDYDIVVTATDRENQTATHVVSVEVNNSSTGAVRTFSWLLLAQACWPPGPARLITALPLLVGLNPSDHHPAWWIPSGRPPAAVGVPLTRPGDRAT